MTSETKFTPGPWVHGPFCKPDETNAECRMFGVGLSIDPETGCSGVRPGDGSDYMLLSGICRREDAALMAAAPDLYAALERATRFIDEQYNDMAKFGGFLPYNTAPLFAALAKARGESQ